MHTISEKSMQALVHAHNAMVQAQAAYAFVAQTIQDAYNLPGSISQINVEALAVGCETEGDKAEE